MGYNPVGLRPACCFLCSKPFWRIGNAAPSSMRKHQLHAADAFRTGAPFVSFILSACFAPPPPTICFSRLNKLGPCCARVEA